jgi:hypothetical protein
MKTFIITLLTFVTAKIAKTLPNGKWKLSRVDYYGKKLPLKNWAFISLAFDQTKQKEGGVHVVDSNGIWDANKGSYLNVTNGGSFVYKGNLASHPVCRCNIAK